MTMKVLHVIPSLAPRDGGPSHAIVPMCAALAALGAEVTIASTDADGPGRLDIPLGSTAWHGVPAVIFTRDFSESFKYSRALASWLRVHVREFDVVHIHAVLSHAPLAAARACRRAGVPYIVRPLGTIASWSLARRSMRKQVLMTLAGKRMLQHAAAIHCTSTAERDDLASLGLTQGVVIPLGIDLAAETAHPAIPRYVLSLSRLHPKKNLETLIRAFVHANRAIGSAWRLVIAGTGGDDYRRTLEQLVSSLDAASTVRFAGWADGAVKQELFASASLFALSSHHENFGIAVLEAAAAGVPAVVSSGVQLADAIRHAGAGWVAGTDEASFRAALEEAMRDPERRAQRGAAAQALARQYAWPSIARQLLALYADVIKVPASHPVRTATVVS